MVLLLSPGALSIINAFCYASIIGFIIIHTFGRCKFFGNPFPFASDYFLTISIVTFVIFEAIIDHYVAAWGFYDPRLVYTKKGGLPHYEDYIKKENIQNGLKMSYAKGTFYLFAVYCIKMVFLLTYRRLFNPRTERRIPGCVLINSTIALTTIGYLSSIGLFLFWCQPISRNWSLNADDRCLSTACAVPFFFSTGVHLISDFVIYLLPFYLLPSLTSDSNGQRRNLLAVRLMFSLGFLCILITMVRLGLTSVEAVPPVIVAFMSWELAAPQILACLPMARRLWLSRREFSMSGRSSEGHGEGSKSTEHIIELERRPTPACGDADGRCDITSAGARKTADEE